MQSMFAFIFGAPKPKARAPTPPPKGRSPTDTLASLRQQEAQLEKRSTYLEGQIKALLEQVDLVARAGDKTKALHLLKKKAMLDDQLRSTTGMLDTITHQRLNLELAQVQVQTIKAIETTNTALKNSGVDAEKAQDAMDELSEHIETSKEINRLFSAPIPGTEDIAESAEAELEAIMARQAAPLAAAQTRPTRVPTPVPDLVSEELRRLDAPSAAESSAGGGVSESRVGAVAVPA